MTDHNIKAGDEFVAVTDDKGGFSLRPKNSGSGGGGGAGILLLLILLFVLLLALALVPLILAISAFFVKDKLVSKLRWYSILTYFGILLCIYFVFPINSDFKEISDGILAHERLFFFGMVLNGIGVLSSIAGITQKLSNKANLRITLFSSVCYIIFALIFYQDYIFGNKIDFTKEQLSKACDCYENSYEQTGIRGDDLSKSDLKIRIDCLDLFEPEDFSYLKDDLDLIYQRMTQACDESRVE